MESYEAWTTRRLGLLLGTDGSSRPGVLFSECLEVLATIRDPCKPRISHRSRIKEGLAKESGMGWDRGRMRSVMSERTGTLAVRIFNFAAHADQLCGEGGHRDAGKCELRNPSKLLPGRRSTLPAPPGSPITRPSSSWHRYSRPAIFLFRRLIEAYSMFVYLSASITPRLLRH